jgi:L-amino acid N-acyltransferase YncA
MAQPSTHEPTPVRPTVEANLDGIVAIIAREVREGVAHFGTEVPTLTEIATDWAKTRARYGWFTALDGDQVAGFAKGGPWKSRGAYQWSAEVGVYVRRESQGRGIGRALYDALFLHLRERGIRTVFAGITLPNDPSVALHEAMGMTNIGVFQSAGYKHGAWRDTGYWQLHWDEDKPPA